LNCFDFISEGYEAYREISNHVKGGSFNIITFEGSPEIQDSSTLSLLASSRGGFHDM